MATEIAFKYILNGMMTTGDYGFSWTYVFFGPLVPLFRGEIGIGVLHWILTIMTAGLWWIAMVFMYNKQYMTRMMTSGWVLAGSESDNAAARAALGMMIP